MEWLSVILCDGDNVVNVNDADDDANDNAGVELEPGVKSEMHIYKICAKYKLNMAKQILKSPDDNYGFLKSPDETFYSLK